MKNLQQAIFIVVALGLCGLCVFQWYGQTTQRNEIQTLEQTVYQKAAAIREYTNSIAAMDHQVAQMDARITQLKDQARTNAEFVIGQQREIRGLRASVEVLTNEISEYKAGLQTLQTKLKEAYDGIKKQNDAMKQLTAERDEFVKKFNDEVKDRNDVVAKYNELAASVEKLRAGSK